ncbi:unnamed protein product [Hermetia illucens]|uniref:Chitin-binding type-2 domain-containing protein n=1 Tax=Hermetia illucens TaxID=343691 RepID=A0A7R8YRL4_HERIL|nr:uncharacterized protein LOC119648252 [Hermetia illucens]CAD7082606.1 unnamed protein product [Hermetia illucens]
MKIVLVLLFALLGYISVASAACIPKVVCKFTSGQSGKPDCSKYSNGSKFRNLNDPVHYWQCDGSAAVSVLCPAGCFYQGKLESCVSVDDWIWEPGCDPQFMIDDNASSASASSGSGASSAPSSPGTACSN